VNQPSGPRPLLGDLFQASVARYGNRRAIECGDQFLSYDALNGSANRWANWLSQHDIGPGCRVGIWLPRGIEVHTVLLGILKCGAAYVPLDPEYPKERVEYIANNSQLKCLITSRSLVEDGLNGSTLIVEIESARSDVAACSETLETPQSLADTSGCEMQSLADASGYRLANGLAIDPEALSSTRRVQPGVPKAFRSRIETFVTLSKRSSVTFKSTPKIVCSKAFLWPSMRQWKRYGWRIDPVQPWSLRPPN
jgi:acyl-CoA synthetase (AMP-forming)/AMP-acid ligase II